MFSAADASCICESSQLRSEGGLWAASSSAARSSASCQKFGQGASAVCGQQAAFEAVAAGEGGQGGVDALPLPNLQEVFGGGDVSGQQGFVAVEGMELFGGLAEQDAGEDEAQGFGAARFEPEAEQCCQGFGFFAGKYGFALYRYAGDAACGQCALYHRALVVAVYQNGDFGRLPRGCFCNSDGLPPLG